MACRYAPRVLAWKNSAKVAPKSAAGTNDQAALRPAASPDRGRGAGKGSAPVRVGPPRAGGPGGRGRSPGRSKRRIHAPLDLAAALYYTSHCSREEQRPGHRCAPQLPTESSPLPTPKDMTSWNSLTCAAQARGSRRFHAALPGAPLLEGARGLRGRMLRRTDMKAREHMTATARMRRSGSSRYNRPDHRAPREGEWNRATRLGGPS